MLEARADLKLKKETIVCRCDFASIPIDHMNTPVSGTFWVLYVVAIRNQLMLEPAPLVVVLEFSHHFQSSHYSAKTTDILHARELHTFETLELTNDRGVFNVSDFGNKWERMLSHTLVLAK